MMTYLQDKREGELAALLEAVAAEARPLLAEGRTGRIVINFSGGSKVRLETAHFRDVYMVKEVMGSRMR